MEINAKKILTQYWGATSFRPGQQESISTVLEKRDGLVVLPTGGGKSLCYQLPGLLLEGVCVVISPLIALMSDQVEALKKKGIRAMHLSGPMSENDLVTALDNCKFGAFKFLYLSPERAQNPLVQEHLAQMKVSLLAIDEAHCISEWGHDFRPSYREIISLKKVLANVPTIALTATATQKVREDICNALELQSPKVVLNSFDRPNITFYVKHTSNKLEAISEALKPYGLPSIVYVGTRKSAELLSNHLNAMGHKTSYFHGGATDKEQRIKNWLTEKIPVMVATTAFGMGIDKPNVTRIVHATLPFSLEQYYQEVGRSGRDGNPSEATLLISDGDEKKLWDILMSTVPSKKEVQEIYKHLCHNFNIAYGELPLSLLEFNLGLFCQHYKLNQKTTYYALKLLERGQVLTLTQYDTPKTIIRIENTKHLLDNVLLDTLLRNVGGITDRFQSIDLSHFAKKCNLPLQKCIETLNIEAKNGRIEIDQLHVDSAIQFNTPREDKRTLLPIIQQLDTFKKEKKRLAKSVWEYCTTPTCLRAKLLHYFGEKIKDKCNSCSNCIDDKTPLNGVIIELKNLLSKGEILSLEQLVLETTHDREQLLSALSFMINEELIEQLNTNSYRWI